VVLQPENRASFCDPSELLDTSLLAIRNGQKLLTSLAEFVSVLARLGVDGPRHFSNPNLDAHGTRIGHGAQFDVFVSNLGLETDRVFKRVRRDLFSNDTASTSRDEAHRSNLRTLQLEISSLCDSRRRNNCNLVELVGWGYDYPSSVLGHRIPVLIMERATCSLLHLLQKGNHRVRSPLSMAIRHHICLDIAEGINCIHSTGLVHGDIKPENVLIFETNDPKVPFVAKLSDFGQCIDLQDAITAFSAYQGTDGWQPPEVAAKNSTQIESFAPDVLQKSDSFIFGLLALSVFLKDGKRLFVSQPQNLPWETSKLVDKTTDAYLDRTMKGMLKNLCCGLLTNTPHNRASVNFQLLQCESISFADW
jgi:serine/threonine protein kinase